MLLCLRWVSVLVLLAAVPCSGADVVDVQACSLEKELLADARDGALGRFDLPTACLIASGVSDRAELSHQRMLLADAAARIQPLNLTPLPPEERARAILHRLHAEMLTGRYDKQATDLRRTLAGGDFNCLSALVLYLELCRQAGLPLEIWSQPGHVFCMPQGRTLRIEPASRQWPAPLSARSSSAQPRRITPLELVGKFYYNRGVQLLEQRQFEQGVALISMAGRLDPHDADAQANLLAGLNNWALALCQQEQHAAAAALIARGLALDPQFPPLLANERYVRGLIGQQ
jgi:hypothetical protein